MTRELRPDASLIVSVLCLLVLPQSLAAQNADAPSRWQGYYFLAPVPMNGVDVSTGLGADIFVYKGLGLNAEGAVAGAWPSSSPGSGRGFGIACADASYHLFPKLSHPAVEPFVEGGYTLFFQSNNAASGYNLGAGINIWLARHAALRLEVRGYPDLSRTAFNPPARGGFATFRIGLTFR